MYLVLSPVIHKASTAYRVVTSWEWAEYTSGIRTTYAYTEHATEYEAKRKAEECNRTLNG